MDEQARRRFGEEYARVRKKLGLSQGQIAHRVAALGGPVFDTSTIARIEGAQRKKLTEGEVDYLIARLRN